jgi:hypothetical protein
MLVKISFVQLYSEVGASFDRVDGPLLQAIVCRFNTLEKNIDELARKFKENDFKLLLTISSKSDISDLEIKGPTIWKRENKVGFSLFIPWRKTNSFIDEVEYILPWIGRGLVSILNRYGVDGREIDQVFQEIIEEAKTSPNRFRYPSRFDSA